MSIITKSTTGFRLEGDVAVVGTSDFAQKLADKSYILNFLRKEECGTGEAHRSMESGKWVGRSMHPSQALWRL